MTCVASAQQGMMKKVTATSAELAASVAMYDIIPFVKEFRIRDAVAKFAANHAEYNMLLAEIATKNAANAPKDKYNMLLAEIAAMNAEHAANIAEIAAKYAANEAKAKYVASAAIATFFVLHFIDHFDWKTLLQSWS